MAKPTRILDITTETHDVRKFRVEKPANYQFTPGQATDVAIDKDGWREEERPFTFTSLPAEDTLEFTIKSYSDHDGVTKQLTELSTSDVLLIGDPWGTIEYDGAGVFIAGGAGITPFLAILRMLAKSNDLAGHKLLFASKAERDIIARTELEGILPDGNLIHVLSDEDKPGYAHGMIDKHFLSAHIFDFDQRFYVCGPPPMMDSVLAALKDLGANPEALTFEK